MFIPICIQSVGNKGGTFITIFMAKVQKSIVQVDNARLKCHRALTVIVKVVRNIAKNCRINAIFLFFFLMKEILSRFVMFQCLNWKMKELKRS